MAVTSSARGPMWRSEKGRAVSLVAAVVWASELVIAVLGSVSRPPMEDALITECPPRSVGGDPCLRAAAYMPCSQLIRVKTSARSACEAGSLLKICLQSVVLGLRVSRGGNCTYGAARRQTLLHRRVLWQLVLRLLSHAFASAVEPVRQLSHVMS